MLFMSDRDDGHDFRVRVDLVEYSESPDFQFPLRDRIVAQNLTVIRFDIRLIDKLNNDFVDNNFALECSVVGQILVGILGDVKSVGWHSPTLAVKVRAPGRHPDRSHGPQAAPLPGLGETNG
jgi:hypothetical protein